MSARAIDDFNHFVTRERIAPATDFAFESTIDVDIRKTLSPSEISILAVIATVVVCAIGFLLGWVIALVLAGALLIQFASWTISLLKGSGSNGPKA